MKKVLLLTGLLLALVASVAMAGGVNIAWGTQCFTDGVFPTYASDGINATFGCASNTSPSTWKMTLSFATNADISDFCSTEVLVKAVSDEATLPDWWGLPSGGCRSGITGIVSVSQDWSTALDNGTVCSDFFGGSALMVAGAIWPAAYPTDALGGGGANEFALKGVISAPNTGALISAGVETYSMMWTIKNGLTVGTTKCTGCSTGMTFGLWYVKALGFGGTTEVLTDVIAGGNQCLVFNNGTYGCQTPVPARNTTWGQVKSLYR